MKTEEVRKANGEPVYAQAKGLVAKTHRGLSLLAFLTIKSMLKTITVLSPTRNLQRRIDKR